MHQRFRVLGSVVDLSGPEQAVAPIAATYARFATDAAPDDAPGRTIALDPESGEIHTGSASFQLLPDLPPTLQLYQQFLFAIVDQVDRYVILHAAAVETPAGEGVVIAAPSGHGKSSLAQELVRRGYRFLSDDYSPLDPVGATIAPYPRTIGVVSGGGSAPVLLGKAQIDPGLIRGEDAVACDPVPLRHVLLLTSAKTSPEELQAWDRHMDLKITCDSRHAARVETAFLQTPGVTIVSRQTAGSCVVYRLSLDARLHPGRKLAPVLEDPAMILVEKVWGDPPRFDATPAAYTVPRRVAAAVLGREVVNRRLGGALMKRYKADTTLLYLDISGALKGVRCHQVQVGRFDETVALIDSLVGLTDRV